MLNINAQIFIDLYKRNLNEDIIKNPTLYGWANRPNREVIIDSLANAVLNGNYDKHGKMFKKTCSMLKIRNTRQGLYTFINEGV